MIRILLVDDDPLVRFGLRLMLRGAPDMEVIAEATDGAEVVVDPVRHLVELGDVDAPCRWAGGGSTVGCGLRGGSRGRRHGGQAPFAD
jgi:hypothetical protein